MFASKSFLVALSFLPLTAFAGAASDLAPFEGRYKGVNGISHYPCELTITKLAPDVVQVSTRIYFENGHFYDRSDVMSESDVSVGTTNPGDTTHANYDYVRGVNSDGDSISNNFLVDLASVQLLTGNVRNSENCVSLVRE